ncbi:MAG: bifunctional lysine ketoglutarate reductase /saccharopine dehydrogenase family protein [Candidatus Aminicenantales bacterium]
MSPKISLGIRREDKNPWERRVPLIPVHARELMRELPLEIRIQPSPIRVFADEDYRREGVTIFEDLSSCSIVLAVKEIPPDFFRNETVYLFFSHTIKGQPHNMPMLKRMMESRATLIDYERIVDEKGFRLVFFGRQAGQAGMIDTLWALGQRLRQEGIKNPFVDIRQTIDYISLVEAKEAIQKTGWAIHNQGLDSSLVPLVFGFAGYGHVSQGAQEIFDLLPFETLAPGEVEALFKNKDYSGKRVYKTVFKEEDMVVPKHGRPGFDLQDYYRNPRDYRPVLDRYLPYLTVLINAIYWAPQYPRFVTKDRLKMMWREAGRPRLRIIGDISCDVDGSVECTVRCTDPAHPVFTYDLDKDEAITGFAGRGPTVMAVDNLPAEIALESSVFFSQTLMPFIPGLVAADFRADFAHCRLPDPLKKAVILFRGEFTPEYTYMRQFISPSERSQP